jgi:transcriptional regulator with XRE-family HTH domain
MGKARKNKNTRGVGRECVMQPSDFKRWRKSLQLSQKQAAEALGLKRRVVQYYEKGVRDGAPVEIPKAIRLACFALSEGCVDYGGPSSEKWSRAPRLATRDRHDANR